MRTHKDIFKEIITGIKGTKIKSKEFEKLLGTKVCTKLNFNENLNKASHEVNVLASVKPSMDLSKIKILANSFFNTI